MRFRRDAYHFLRRLQTFNAVDEESWNTEARRSGAPQCEGNAAK